MRKIVIILTMASLVVLPLFMVNAEVSEEAKQTQKMIEEKGLNWTASQTSTTDLSLEERMACLGLVIPEDVKLRFAELDKLPPPVLLNTETVFDWREFNRVTPVKDQADCGSCWDFAATGAFESVYWIAEDIMPDFSEQQVLVCNEGGSDCGGGWMEDAYNLFMSYGAVDESCMPYEADDTIPCTQEECEPIALLLGYEDIPNNINAIKNALMFGPLSTTFTVYNDFLNYPGGCYEHAGGDPANHAVVLIGWDDNMCDGYGAWICKNSWGEDWGDEGFFYIKYHSAGIGGYTQRPIYVESTAQLEYSPNSIEVNLPSGGEVTEFLEISNIGNGDLVYSLQAVHIIEQDSFGYYWFDCDTSEGPTYDWIDISGIGEIIDFGDDIDDGNSGPLPLGFTFEFYGNEFDSINVCTNGWASFTDGISVEWGNQPIPHPEPPNNMLAVFYDDMNLENGGRGLFYTNNADTAIITWDHVPDWRQEGIFTFQIIIAAPRMIIYQYNSMGPGRLNESSIGIENQSGTVGLEVALDTYYVHDLLAVEFYLGPPPTPLTWIDISPANGIISPSDNVLTDVIFSAGELPDSSYEAILRLLTNDPNHFTNNIPVTMNVGQVGIDDDITAIPSQFDLYPAFPNPFNLSTTISYTLSEPANTTLEVFNILGQKVATLYDDYQTAGEHSVRWEAEDMTSGIYFIRLSSGESSLTGRLILLK